MMGTRYCICTTLHHVRYLYARSRRHPFLSSLPTPTLPYRKYPRLPPPGSLGLFFKCRTLRTATPWRRTRQPANTLRAEEQGTCYCFRHSLAMKRALLAWTKHVVCKHPRKVVAASVAVALILAVGILRIDVRTKTDELWVPLRKTRNPAQQTASPTDK